MENLEKLAYEWATIEPEKADIKSEFYCQTRDVFQARLEKMTREMIAEGKIEEDEIYIISAIAGEIGNNSFDHNVGSWPDVPGVFFGYNLSEEKNKIILVDRGRGILKTLKKVKPDIADDKEALEIAFTQKISGRAPENRGNGLKFVKSNIKEKKLRLLFVSGNALAEVNEKMEIKDSNQKINGCLAILSF